MTFPTRFLRSLARRSAESCHRSRSSPRPPMSCSARLSWSVVLRAWPSSSAFFFSVFARVAFSSATSARIYGAWGKGRREAGAAGEGLGETGDEAAGCNGGRKDGSEGSGERGARRERMIPAGEKRM